MEKEKLSIQELVDRMVEEGSFTKKMADEFIRTLMATIEEALLNGESVKLKGLGTFTPQWNEARKSVDVNTGEEIVIPGYYKAVFTPDSSLKNAVNTPYAHLESVSLDSKTDKSAESIDAEQDDYLPDVGASGMEPIKFLEEQASEIKDLINDINSMAIKAVEPDLLPEERKEEVVPAAVHNPGIISEAEKEIEFKDVASHIIATDGFGIVRDLSLIRQESETSSLEGEQDVSVVLEVNESELDQQEFCSPDLAVDKLEVIDGKGEGVKTTEKKEEDTSEFSEETAIGDTVEMPKEDDIVRKKKKSSVWWWLILIPLLAVSVLWFLYNYKNFLNIRNSKNRIELLADSIANELRVRHLRDSLKVAPDSVLIDADLKTIEDSVVLMVDSGFIDEAKQKQIKGTPAPVEVETKQITETKTLSVNKTLTIDELAQIPRNFNENLAVEKMVVGSQLTKFARQYYGHHNFWVYIYEANKNKISNPDNVPTGIDIKIPKVDKRLVDPSNKNALELALQLQREYLK